MALGQVLIIIGFLGLLDSIFAEFFPKLASHLYRRLRFKELGTSEKAVRNIAITEFFVSLVVFVIGMNI